MTTTTPTARVAEVLGPRAGDHHHFLGELATVKVRGSEDSPLSVVEFVAPLGAGAPLHRHLDEDELFIILDGELNFHVSGKVLPAGPGSTTVLPRGLAHTFQVTSTTARMICITASPKGHPRFDAMVTELGVPTGAPTIPQPAYIDATEVAEVCLAHGIEILGPPPGPLS